MWLLSGGGFSRPTRVPGCRFWAVSRPADTSIALFAGKVNGFFREKEPAASLYMREARREKTEKTRFFFARPGTPPVRTAARKARTQACTVSRSSQRHTGVTNSVP